MVSYPNDTVPGTTGFYLVRAGPGLAVVYVLYAWLTLRLYPNVTMWATYAAMVGAVIVLMQFVGIQSAIASSRRRTGDPIEIETSHFAFWRPPSPSSPKKDRIEVRFSRISAVSRGGFSKPYVLWHEGESPPSGLKGYQVTLLTPSNAKMLSRAWENWKTGMSSPSFTETPLAGTVSFELAAHFGPAKHPLQSSVMRTLMVGIGVVMIVILPAIVGPYRLVHWNGDVVNFGMVLFIQGILSALGVLLVWQFGVRLRQGASRLGIQDDGIRVQYPNGKIQWISWATQGVLFTLKDQRKMPFHTGDGFIIETATSPETNIPEGAFVSLIQRATTKGCTVRRRVHTEYNEGGTPWGEWSSFEVSRP
ncbi:MAG: hypothetical protein M1144_05645 [Candidatus Thermoplasmatota archaeon]|nr:hypothetical protein [Candidatus Thermoplasmatota archaeon]